MPDALSAAQERQFESGGRSFRFRRPAVRQVIAADVLAAQYRGGLPVTALTYGLALSEARAALNTYCVEPRTVPAAQDGFDFGDLDEDALMALYTEVSSWLDSFRARVDSAQGGLG